MERAVPGVKYGNAGVKVGSSAAGSQLAVPCKLGMTSDKGGCCNGRREM